MYSNKIYPYKTLIISIEKKNILNKEVEKHDKCLTSILF